MQDNIKAQMSTGKPKMHLLPPDVIREIAEIITEGSAEHQGENWLTCHPNQYIDALFRHLLEVMKDIKSVNKGNGPGTRLNAAYIAANAVILLDIINNHIPKIETTETWTYDGSGTVIPKGLELCSEEKFKVKDGKCCFKKIKGGKKSGKVPKKR